MSSAGALNIGTTTATSITVGKSGITTTFPGDVTVAGTFSPAGITSLASLTVTGGNILIPAAYAIDTAAGGILNIGTTTATTINIGRTGQVVAILSNASTTQVSASGIAWLNGNVNFGGFATTTATTGAFATQGAVAASSTLQVTSDQTNYGTLTIVGTGATTLGGALAVTGVTTLTGDLKVNGFATTTALTGAFATQGAIAASSTLQVTSAVTTYGTVTNKGAVTNTSTVTVGSAGTAVSGIVFGFCNIPITAVNATSTNYAVCSNATGVAVNDRVFVQATSSFPTTLVVQAASSTATDTISLRLFNPGDGVNASNSTDAISLNFWAFR